MAALRIQQAWRSYKWKQCRSAILDSLCCCVCQDVRSDILVCHNSHPICAKCHVTSSDLIPREMVCPVCSDQQGFLPTPMLYLADALQILSRCSWCETAVPIRRKNAHENFCASALYECPRDGRCAAMRLDTLFEHVWMHAQEQALDIDANEPIVLVVSRKIDVLVRVRRCIVRLTVERDGRAMSFANSSSINYSLSAGVYGSKATSLTVENYVVDHREVTLKEALKVRAPQLCAPEGFPQKIAVFMSRVTVGDLDAVKDGVALRGDPLASLGCQSNTLASLQPRSFGSGASFNPNERQPALVLKIGLRVQASPPPSPQSKK